VDCSRTAVWPSTREGTERIDIVTWSMIEWVCRVRSTRSPSTQIVHKHVGKPAQDVIILGRTTSTRSRISAVLREPKVIAKAVDICFVGIRVGMATRFAAHTGNSRRRDVTISAGIIPKFNLRDHVSTGLEGARHGGRRPTISVAPLLQRGHSKSRRSS